MLIHVLFVEDPSTDDILSSIQPSVSNTRWSTKTVTVSYYQVASIRPMRSQCGEAHTCRQKSNKMQTLVKNKMFTLQALWNSPPQHFATLLRKLQSTTSYVTCTDHTTITDTNVKSAINSISDKFLPNTSLNFVQIAHISLASSKSSDISRLIRQVVALRRYRWHRLWFRDVKWTDNSWSPAKHW